MRPDQVRAQDAVGSLFDEDLEPVGRLGDATRRVPVGRLLRFHAKPESLFACFGFTQTDCRNRWNAEGDARHPRIVRLQRVAFEHVGRCDFRVVTRYRGEGRAHLRGIAGRIYGRVRNAL